MAAKRMVTRTPRLRLAAVSTIGLTVVFLCYVRSPEALVLPTWTPMIHNFRAGSGWISSRTRAHKSRDCNLCMSQDSNSEQKLSVLQAVERVLEQECRRSSLDDMNPMENLKRTGGGVLAGLALMAGAFGFMFIGGGEWSAFAAGDDTRNVVAPTSAVTVRDLQRYNGFEDYAAQGQQMENSDVGCFANECKRETASCFTDGSCLKGVTCLGRCKGEQECATRCFAQFGSEKLDSWLTCTLEDHSCVKIPKDMDFSSIDRNPPQIVKGFDPKELQGTWYKVMGVNKKYDCFDCQRNTFSVAKAPDGAGLGESTKNAEVADIKVNFRLKKYDSDDFWENTITEQLQVDPEDSPRTFHTDGKLFGLSFKENWYVTGHSTDPGGEFVFVQYKGHTLQGTYAGGFVYSRKPTLPNSALAKVNRVARDHGIDPNALTPIDNMCPSRPSLPRAADTNTMSVFERVKYEMSFVYDLMEWVHPGTIHKYARADQKKFQASQKNSAGSLAVLNGDDG